MRDDFNRPIHRSIPIPIENSSNHINSDVPYHKKNEKKKLLISVVVIVLVIVAGASLAYIFYFRNKTSGILPYPISKQAASLLSYDIYYPNQKLLPQGYTLDKNSFSYTDQALLYSVSFGNNQKLFISNQDKPPVDQLQAFYTKKIPLHFTVNTKIGTATIGAIGKHSVVSIPTNTNDWILITGPLDIDNTKLKQVINSIQPVK